MVTARAVLPPLEKRDARMRLLALLALSLIAFVVIQLPFVLLVRKLCGSAPVMIRAIPGYAMSTMLGMTFAYRGDIGLGVFLKYLRIQGIVAVAGLGLAVSIKAMGGF